MKKIFLSIIFALVSAFTFAQTMYVCKGGNYTAVDITDGLEISLTEGIDSITFYEPQFDNPSLTKDYTVEIAATENGTVIADVSEAKAGETVTLTVTPAEGYEFETLMVTYDEDGKEVEITATEETGIYTFTMPEGNVTVSATFAEIPQETVYTVNIAESENGIVISDVSEAQAGETVTLTVIPYEGYEFETLTVTCGEDGADVDVAATKYEGLYTFTMPESDVTVSAIFAEIPQKTVYTVNIAASENGTVTADVSEAQAGETVTLTVTPAEGYDIATLTVTYGKYGTGVKVVATEDEGVYTFTMPENDVTVSATFAGISGEPIYYWYLGQENPLTMTSISPIVTNDRDGWRLIGDKLNTPYSSSNMFFKGIIKFNELKQGMYVALPTEANVYVRSQFDHSSILTDWVKQTTKDIEGVNYTIYLNNVWAMEQDVEIY